MIKFEISITLEELVLIIRQSINRPWAYEKRKERKRKKTCKASEMRSQIPMALRVGVNWASMIRLLSREGPSGWC